MLVQFSDNVITLITYNVIVNQGRSYRPCRPYNAGWPAGRGFRSPERCALKYFTARNIGLFFKSFYSFGKYSTDCAKIRLCNMFGEIPGGYLSP